MPAHRPQLCGLECGQGMARTLPSRGVLLSMPTCLALTQAEGETAPPLARCSAGGAASCASHSRGLSAAGSQPRALKPRALSRERSSRGRTRAGTRPRAR